MKGLILNSGVGKRMGDLTSRHPKCMTEILEGETILSRQLKLLKKCGIIDIVITTGPFDKILIDYCDSLNLSLQYTFVNNPVYDNTNYIYSIFLAREHLNDDIVMMHGDLVFEHEVLEDVLEQQNSNMAVSSTIPLPEKDFKAVIKNGLIEKVGVEYFQDAMAAQPLYKLNKADWRIWLDSIVEFCKRGLVTCYAENAFNEVSHKCHIYPMDFKDNLCREIDTPQDLIEVKERLTDLTL